jgi:hypothetical protein
VWRGRENERTHSPIDHFPATFIAMKLKIILDLMKYVQQTVCKSWAEFVYPDESMFWGLFMVINVTHVLTYQLRSGCA